MPTPDPILAAPASPRAALLVIDVQKDFIPGGRLPVADGDAVVPLINRLGARFGNVVLTQDWHPADHRSFASQHAGRAPFEQIELPYGAQTLWPDHCVQASDGAALHAGLRLPQAGLIIRKGRARDVDSYSAVVEADRRTATGLAGYLRERGIDTVYLAGLALDFCVAWSALDARAAGFATAVVADACRAIDLDGSLARAWQRMDAAGVRRLAAAALPAD
jgi:nicotinamidase/pyrazinamidase